MVLVQPLPDRPRCSPPRGSCGPLTCCEYPHQCDARSYAAPRHRRTTASGSSRTCGAPRRVIEAVQTEKDGEKSENHRLIAVSEACQLFGDIRKLTDLPEAIASQIEHFFISYNEQAGKKFAPSGRSGRKRAAKILEQGRRRA